jgi:hypothetical protein
MHQTKVPVATTKTFGARMGDNALLPVPLRHLAQTADGAGAEEFFSQSWQLLSRHPRQLPHNGT